MKPASRKQSVREEYDALSDRYESRWSKYTRRSVWETLRRAPLNPTDRILDVGCGTGALIRELRRRHPTISAVGVDLSTGMLAAARRTSAANVVAGDAEDLPFQSATFDAVISSSSFHFWPDPKRGLLELRRVLKNGGRMVITDWCDDFIVCRVCDAYLRFRDPAHQRIFSERQCVALLESAGFRVLRTEKYRISLLWGLMTAVAEVRA